MNYYLNKQKLINEGFVKVCDKTNGCFWVHPDGRKVKLINGGRIISIK